MWQTYTTALVLALSFSALAFGVAKALVVAATRRLERRHGAVSIRDVLARRARLEQGLEARRGDREAALKAIDTTIEEVILRRQQLERRLAEAARAGDPVIRLIGEEVAGSPCFVAQVTNRHAGSAPAMPIDPSWAQPQAVEVWAPSIQEARQELERHYPASFGYRITRLQEAGPPLRAAS